MSLWHSTNDFPLTAVGGIFYEKLKAVKNDRVQVFAISKQHADIALRVDNYNFINRIWFNEVSESWPFSMLTIIEYCNFQLFVVIKNS